MSAITFASLTAIPSGSLIDLDAEGTLDWFRPGDAQFDYWVGPVLSQTYYPPRLPAPHEGNTAACKTFDQSPFSFGQLSFGLAAGRIRDSTISVNRDGLIGHKFVDGKRLYFPVSASVPPEAWTLTESASPAFAITTGSYSLLPSNSDGKFHGGLINVGVEARPSPFTVDYYFWYQGGAYWSWRIEALFDPQNTYLQYDQGTHGSMVTNQCYRLRVAFAGSSPGIERRFLMMAWGEGSLATVAFSCATMRDGTT